MRTNEQTERQMIKVTATYSNFANMPKTYSSLESTVSFPVVSKQECKCSVTSMKREYN
jgi:hypothetical protein